MPVPDVLLLSGGRVHTGSRTIDRGWVALSSGRVSAVGAGEPPAELRAAELIDTTGHDVVPGFVDLHCHGGGGASFADGPDAAERAARAHRRHGTTTLVASLVTAPLPALRRQIDALTGLVEDGVLAGVHLEGPWLSPRHRGAHDPALLRAPAAEDIDLLLRGGTVRVVTLAPELDGGMAAVLRVAGAGAVAALGHSDADDVLAAIAVDAGVRLATHLFNAMPPIHHRRPGPVPALLADPRVTVELIADGVHLHPLVLAHAARAAGPGRTALVTDAMAAAAAADGRYRLGELPVKVRDGRATLADGTIAGSTLTTDAALRHAVQGAGLPFGDALAALTTAPAAVLGRDDIGHLEPGARADVVVLDDELRVREVVAGGRRV